MPEIFLKQLSTVPKQAMVIITAFIEMKCVLGTLQKVELNSKPHLQSVKSLLF